MKRARDAARTLEWATHGALGVGIVFVLALGVAAALRVPLVVALVPLVMMFWQLCVPSEALGVMRANGATSASAAARVCRRLAGDSTWEYLFGRSASAGEGDVARGVAGGAVGGVAWRRARKRGTGVGLKMGRRALPPVNEWPHRPLFVRSSPRSFSQRVTDGWASKSGPMFRAVNPNAKPVQIDASAPVNTETAMSFETELFVGKIVCRFKGVEDAHSRTPDSFYAAKKCTFQVLVQGRFKERVKVSDMLTGGEWDRPFENVPPTPLVIAGQQFFKQLTPGLITDLLCEEPYYYAPIGTTLSVLAAHAPEDAPEPTSDIKENTRRFGGAFAEGRGDRSINDRCRIFSDSSSSEKYYFNTEDVYTFDYFQSVLLFNDYCLDITITRLPLNRCLNGQPLSFFAKHRDGRYAYSFEIWHECLLAKAPERTPVGSRWPPADT